MSNNRPVRKADVRLTHLMEYCEGVKSSMNLMEGMIKEIQKENKESKRNDDKTT